MKITKKLIERYLQLVNHPLVVYPLIGLIKYIYINLRIRIYHKPIKIKWLNNLRYHLSLGDCGGIIGNYYFYILDFEESIFLIHYLTDLDMFIDVGSNHGHYTMISSGICGSKTLSIEPVKETFNRLKMNIELNELDNVVMYNLGISDSEGELFFTNDKGPMNMVINQTNGRNIEKVKVTTLDNLLDIDDNVSVLKIDVERFEKQVLIGSRNLLKNDTLNVIIIELFYGIGEEEILSILNENGFSPYKYIYPDNELVPLEKKNFDSYNTIFIRNIDLVKNRINQKSITINKNNVKIKRFSN